MIRPNKKASAERALNQLHEHLVKTAKLPGKSGVWLYIGQRDKNDEDPRVIQLMDLRALVGMFR